MAGLWQRMIRGLGGGKLPEPQPPEPAPHDDENLPETIVLTVTDVLDLHTFPPREIPDLIHEYLDAAHRSGFRHVRIIHGKGIGVQRDITRKILQGDPRVVAFGDPPPEAGGWGATWVELQ